MHALSPHTTPVTHTRLLLVEPANLVRSCLKALFAQLDDVEVAGAVATMVEGTSLAEALAPDVVVVNITALTMTGFAALRHLRERCPAAGLLILRSSSSQQSIEEGFCGEAHGVVNITATLEELRGAIRLTLAAVRQQERNAPAATAQQRQPYGAAKPPPPVKLTPRESEVLSLIASGRTNKAIAASLGLSISTIERHRTNLIRKLDLHNAAALTAYAIRTGLVSFERNTPRLVNTRPAAG